ncbi:MAG: nuclear transport factor 2 family protein [Bacteroidia bacterium]|nr:nuclear transport factor 2 family protein [Bacteroidia bacterium]
MRSRLLLLFLCTALLSACGPAAEKQAPAAVSEAVETPEQKNEKLVRTYFDHFNRHDWNKMAAMYSDPAEFRDPSFGKDPVKQTRAEVAKKYGEMGAVFPDMRDEITAVYASGDKHVTVEFTSRATDPDGSKFELPICVVFTIENGLITKDYTYYDNTGE